LTIATAACSDDGGPAITPDDFEPPTTGAEVEDVYDQLDTCNESFITRSLTARPEIVTTTLWTTPATDPAGLVAWRAKTGWTNLLLASELTFNGISDDVKSPDSACSAVQKLLSPVRPQGTDREQFAHVLVYLDEAQHAYTSFPAGGLEMKRTPAKASVVGYLSVIFAEREFSGSDVIYRDVREQHLPMFISCDQPFEVETTVAMFDTPQLDQVDTALCDAGTDLDNDGDLDHRCVAERGLHAETNRCTFVVDASALETLDGTKSSVIFGGTIAGGKITVDRFSKAR
jgi:hypothetical protein